MRLYLIALALAAASEFGSYQPTQQEIDAAETWYKALLKDPYSAKIGKASGRFVNGAPQICFNVNAKNGFGAYTGIEAVVIQLKDGKPNGQYVPFKGLCPE